MTNEPRKQGDFNGLNERLIGVECAAIAPSVDGTIEIKIPDELMLVRSFDIIYDDAHAGIRACALTFVSHNIATNSNNLIEGQVPLRAVGVALSSDESPRSFRFSMDVRVTSKDSLYFKIKNTTVNPIPAGAIKVTLNAVKVPPGR